MSQGDGSSWVEACIDWTAKSVLGRMRVVSDQASRSRGAVAVGGRASLGPPQAGDVSDYGTGAGFVVELHGRGLAASRGMAVSFETKNSDEGNALGAHDCIEARTVIHEGGSNEVVSTKVARLGLDCATGEPCLLDEGGQGITIEEFVREVLLPVLFPGIMALDHSAEANRGT